MGKIPNFDSFGAVFPHFCPYKREIWDGSGPAVYQGNVSPLLQHFWITEETQYQHGYAARRPAGNRQEAQLSQRVTYYKSQ